MKQNIKTSVGVVIIIILAITAGTFVWMAQKDNSVSKQASAPISAKPQKSQPQTSQQKDETAGWQTYRNEKYGLEFKYPKDWIINSEEDLPWIIMINDNVDKSSFAVRIVAEPEGFIFGSDAKENIIIDNKNYDAYLFPTGYEVYGDVEILPGDEHSQFFIPIAKNNKWLILQGQGGIVDKINYPHNQIISTFKFTN